MYKLKLRDYLKAFLMAVGVPVINAVLESLNAGEVTINWNHIWKIAVGAFLVYLLKNFLTDDMKVATKVIKSEATTNEPVILPVDVLPATGVTGVWYFFNNSYYFWDGTTKNYTNYGAFRPTDTPQNT